MVNDTWKFDSSPQELDDRTILAGGYNLNSILHPTGLCQSETFFFPVKEEILTLFQQKAILSRAVEKLVGLIKNSESVAVQIRQGDVPDGNRVPLAYHKYAMKHILQELGPTSHPTFFIFCEAEEEVEILRQEFSPEIIHQSQLHFVCDTNALSYQQYFYALSKCKHSIIYNSFGWWAAYLNTNLEKFVVAAHFDPEEIELMFKDPRESFYMKWQFRYMYFPINWHVVDIKTLDV